MKNKYLLPVSVDPANRILLPPAIKSLESRSSIVKVIQNATLKWVHTVIPQIINDVRSDDLWTGKISKNILMYQMIGIINLKNTGTGILLYI